MAASLALARRRAPRFCTTVLPCLLLAACSGGSTNSTTGSVSTPVLDTPRTTPNPDPGTPPSSTPPASAPDALLSLSWRANTDPITGYRVYYGPTAEAATALAADLAIDANGFDPAAPRVSFKAAADLHLNPGDRVCFRLRAYNVDAVSDWSQAVCDTI